MATEIDSGINPTIITIYLRKDLRRNVQGVILIAKDRSLVRASDIGSWTFCNRAWWLANVKKAPHENPAAFERGDSMHERHGRQVALAGMAQRIGLGLIGVALLLIIGLLLWSQL